MKKILVICLAVLFASNLFAASTSVRSISGSSASIVVTPESSVSAYAIEESIPAGLTPANINQSGVWDAANRKIKWGLFTDSSARTFTYEVSGSDGNYTVSGIANFDGTDEVTTTGDTQFQFGGGGSGTSVRSISGSTASIVVTPESSVSAYAVEENIPTGLTPANINQSGVWDSANRKIKWGLFTDSSVRTFTYEVSGADGVYTVSGVANFDGTDEITTTGDSQINISDTKPDLIIENCSCNPTTLYSDRTISYSINIKNQGKSDAGGFAVGYFISKNVNELNQKLSMLSNVSQLDINETKTMSGDFLWPKYGEYSVPGKYYFSVMIDEENKVLESNENNNWGQPIEINILDESKPDLYDAGESWNSFSPKSLLPNDNIIVKCVLRNSEVMASGSFVVKFYASVDTNIDSLDYYLGQKSMESILASGWENCDLNNGTIPSDIPAGSYYVGWVIDANDNVNESNENNNKAYKTGYKLTIESADNMSIKLVKIKPDTGKYKIIGWFDTLDINKFPSETWKDWDWKGETLRAMLYINNNSTYWFYNWKVNNSLSNWRFKCTEYGNAKGRFDTNYDNWFYIKGKDSDFINLSEGDTIVRVVFYRNEEIIYDATETVNLESKQDGKVLKYKNKK